MTFKLPISNYRQAATFISKKAKEFTNLNESVRTMVESGISEFLGDAAEIKNVDKFESSIIGLDGGRSAEAVPRYIKAPGERVISNSNNAWIVLGRDRQNNRASGYGGAGHSGASAIDLVVGRAASSLDDNIYVDPNFKSDAARIYISQKSDIDDYLSLVDGSVGNSKGRSAIGLKADSIRLASRQGIKIVTNVGDTNSFGGTLLSTKGIDLIAGNNEDELQPIPKGDNLVDAIEAINDNMSKLNAIVFNFITNQAAFNAVLQAHTHAATFGLGPSIELQPVGTIAATQIMSNIPKLWANKVNMEFTFGFNYLRPFSSKYINGTNRTN
jgi:hypothetical protein